ncbi:tRNA (adenosine(37)-N6)-threonylcarbamoyltransferase complex dimerization subunit type 1 TsaB [Alteromonas gracilis]|uniref:tRNA (adenosine(37)-N6)-threonylcarbamoyltransferase complex dimerization subunit type 1 TsaB n=1 Tax=Alteromonas gracilis TaxID=1479524 RepID=UPI00321B5905
MKILAIDTATEACSVALLHDDIITSRFEVCPQQHSQRLLPMVDDVLKDADLTLSELDLLAFGRGPGSFTGYVRIATGMIQGLSLGTGLKVAGVSTLEAMAHEVASLGDAESSIGVTNKYIAVASDARMDEVYFAVFKQSESDITLVVAEQVCPPHDAVEQLNELAGLNKQNVIAAGTGWSAYDALGQWLQQCTTQEQAQVTLPNARFMLELAQHAHENGTVTEATSVEPVYLRDKVTWKKLPGRE